MHRAATISARMPEQEKPYRVYKGGRAKGKVPLQRPATNDRPDSAAPGAPPKPKRRRVGRRIALATRARVRARRRLARRELLLVLAGNHRRQRACSRAGRCASLTKQDGLLTSTPTTILVLGTDGGTQAGPRRRESLRLDHADPHRSAQASAGLPLDPARPEGRHPGHGAPPRSTPPSSTAARHSRCGR